MMSVEDLGIEPAGAIEAPPLPALIEPADVGEAEPPAPAAVEPAEPVRAEERVASVDVLRGVALLGILAMNIVSFGWPDAAYGQPTRGGGFAGLDRAIWVFNHLAFEMKMMTLFSMLFGAGLALMADRAEARGRSLRGVYYRRCLWLLVIGLCHAYLIWAGDILVLYAECGLLLYLFRRKTPRTLITLGLVVTMVLVPVVLGVGAGLDYLKANAARVEAKQKAGQEPTRFEAQMQQLWTRSVQPHMRPDPIGQARNWNDDLLAYSGGYLGIVRHRAPELLVEQTLSFVLVGLWLAGGRMLLGMGLMKLGVFSARRSRRFYARMMLLGYGVGLPLVAYDAYAQIRHDFEPMYFLRGGIVPNYVGSVLVALGHVGLVMTIYQAGVLTWLTRRLAAVGRMALSNYLMHSIVCTTLFYGYGFNLFGTINRTGLAGIVVAIWIVQLLVSPVWLERFRFGPAEWLWRSLTYWKLQPMRRRSELEFAA
jgi:uncharacterized protein